MLKKRRRALGQQLPKDTVTTPRVVGTQRSNWNYFRIRTWNPVIETPQNESPDSQEMCDLDNVGGPNTRREVDTVKVDTDF